ncbi:hypothetical protein DFJ74DRAFT_430816 [Hyaloraphidium curvatum]|nr:hypothetical protein DFJ74DRAFT_430816 [Hyaloraphidium curvatum]
MSAGQLVLALPVEEFGLRSKRTRKQKTRRARERGARRTTGGCFRAAGPRSAGRGMPGPQLQFPIRAGREGEPSAGARGLPRPSTLRAKRAAELAFQRDRSVPAGAQAERNTAQTVRARSARRRRWTRHSARRARQPHGRGAGRREKYGRAPRAAVRGRRVDPVGDAGPRRPRATRNNASTSRDELLFATLNEPSPGCGASHPSTRPARRFPPRNVLKSLDAQPIPP